MIIFKLFILSMIIGASSAIGILFSKKYANREKELKEMKNSLNIFATKIKFTYESVPPEPPNILVNILFLISNKPIPTRGCNKA